nr:hypothetical protein [Nanchangia anserum]
MLNSTDIWNVYTMTQALDDVADAFVAVSGGRTMTPLRTKICPDSRRTVLTMPAYAPGVDQVSVKTIALYPDNASRGLPTAPASLVLVDGKTGMTRAFLDGDTVTKFRTGASSGVAFRHLGRDDAQVGLVVGTGGQAFTQVLALLAAAPTLSELRIANPFDGQAEEFVTALRAHPGFAQAGFSGRITTWLNADEAAAEADLIILVTSSTSPVLHADTLKPGVTISCVGSYQPHMQECGADVMARADKIYCDDVEAALEESGDLIIPLESGDIDRADIRGAIGEVIAGDLVGRERDDEIIVYETVGVGAQDLWAAQAIVNAAEEAGVGTDWE